MASSATSEQVDSLQQQMQKIEQQLSTQDKFSQPSEDPGDASIVMVLQRTLDSQNQYLSNVQSSQSQLSEVAGEIHARRNRYGRAGRSERSTRRAEWKRRWWRSEVWIVEVKDIGTESVNQISWSAIGTFRFHLENAA